MQHCARRINLNTHVHTNMVATVQQSSLHARHISIREREKRKEKIRRCASVAQRAPISPAIFYTRAQITVDHDNGLLFRSTADTLGRRIEEGAKRRAGWRHVR